MKPSIYSTNEAKIIFLWFAIFFFASFSGFLDGLEVKTIDWRFHFRGTKDTNKEVALVVISDECLDQVGKWPWSRKIHAQAIDTISKAGAKVIAYDVIFNDPSETDMEGDRELVLACRRARNVIFPMYSAEVKIFDPNTSIMETQTEIFRPFPYLASSALDLGLINVDFRHLNPDGIVRRIYLFADINGEKLPFLPLSIANAALSKFGNTAKPDNLKWHEDQLFLGNTQVPQTKMYKILRDENGFHLYEKASLLINYLGMTTSGAIPTIYFSDVIAGAIDTRVFKDKIVLIGPSAVGLGDIKLTPFGEMPGVLIHANIVNNLVQGNYLHYTGNFFNLTILTLISFILLLILQRTSPGVGALWTLLLLVSYNFFALSLFLNLSLVIEMVIPSLQIIVVFLIVRFWQMVQKLRQAYQSLQERTLELERTNKNLDHRVQELTVINEAGFKFPSILDIESLSQEILEFFKDLCKAEKLLLYIFEQESDCLKPMAGIGVELDEGSILLCDPGVAEKVKHFLEERSIIYDRDGKWFTAYLPLLIGNRLWGGIFLKENFPDPLREGQERFWSTLLGLASTALENANLYHLATVDSLTKLYVRRFFNLQLEKELKRGKRYGGSASLLITDIDHFKKFNDTYGHQQGDLVLREVANAVKDSLRDVDIAARYGGEEFSIILPQTNLEGALIVAERIRIQVERMYVPRVNCPGDFLKVTLSIGVASFPETQVETSAQFIEAADAALYRGKDNGRNRVEHASPTISEENPVEE